MGLADRKRTNKHIPMRHKMTSAANLSLFMLYKLQRLLKGTLLLIWMHEVLARRNANLTAGLEYRYSLVRLHEPTPSLEISASTGRNRVFHLAKTWNIRQGLNMHMKVIHRVEWWYMKTLSGTGGQIVLPMDRSNGADLRRSGGTSSSSKIRWPISDIFFTIAYRSKSLVHGNCVVGVLRGTWDLSRARTLPETIES
jgi:hypothetical protein